MSLDPETMLGIKLATAKTAAAGTLFGVLFRRQFSLGEMLSAVAAGFGSGYYLAPAINSVLRLFWNLGTDDTIETGIVFIFGMLGLYIFSSLSTSAPALLRGAARWVLRLPPQPESPTPADPPAPAAPPTGKGGAS